VCPTRAQHDTRRMCKRCGPIICTTVISLATATFCVAYLALQQVVAKLLCGTVLAANHVSACGTFTCRFYPRDAMLARQLAMALCPSVSLSVTSLCFMETGGRIGLVFGMAASFDLHSVIRKFRYREKQGYFPAGTLS